MSGTMLEPGLTLDQRIELMSPLGRGGQAQVWRVREIAGKREIAAKLVVVPAERRAEISEQAIDSEIKKLSVLSGQFIVIMHYAIYVLIDDTGDIVVGYTMPLANGGTLDSNDTYRQRLRTDRNELFETMLSIGRGISTIHDQDFVHGDIKPSNVLLFAERNLVFPRVSDLGAAYLASLGFGVAFDPRYAAPERFNSRYETATTYNKKLSDIYSLGLLFFELMTGSYAYGDNLYFEFPYQGLQRVHEEYLPDWNLIPMSYGGFISTLKAMLDKKPANRPDIDTVIGSLEGTRSAVQVETTQGHRKKRDILSAECIYMEPPVTQEIWLQQKDNFC